MSFKINKATIGDNSQPPYFVAELGSNWVTQDGDNSQADRRLIKLVEQAAIAGFDAIKLQMIRPNELYRDQGRIEELECIAWEGNWTPRYVRDLCDFEEVDFIVTPFHVDAVGKALPYVDAFKVASGDITYEPLLDELALQSLPIIVSTGCAEMDTVRWAYKKLNRRNDVAFLHCVVAYPTMGQDSNLRAMIKIKQEMWRPAGWSDHTVDQRAILAATALGADIIEMHFDYDGNGMEALHSWLPLSAEKVIREARDLYNVLGDGVKRISTVELGELKAARRDPETWTRPVK